MTAVEPIPRTLEEQVQTLANNMPGGRVFGAKNVTDSNVRNLLRGLVGQIDLVDRFIAEFRRDTVPDQTRYFLDEWERALGIPDDCFDGKDATPVGTWPWTWSHRWGETVITGERRRLAIVTKLAALGVQTNMDFVNLALTFGISVTITAGAVSGLFSWVWPHTWYTTAQEARFTIIVTPIDGLGTTFTYTFNDGPDLDGIVFGTSETAVLECLFQKFKPANVQVIFQSP